MITLPPTYTYPEWIIAASQEDTKLTTGTTYSRTYKSVDEMLESFEKERQLALETPWGCFYYLIWLPLTRIYSDTIYFFRITFPELFIRAKQGWASSDTWGLDSYLSQMIWKTTSHLIDNIHGYPGNLTEQEWEEILCQISNTFFIAKQISYGDIILTKTERDYKKLTKIYKDSLADVIVYSPEQTKEFYEGFDLFKKYFFYLND